MQKLPPKYGPLLPIWPRGLFGRYNKATQRAEGQGSSVAGIAWVERERVKNLAVGQNLR